LELSTFHAITPYSEVYGMHPRDFDFGRSYHKILKVPINSRENDDSDDDDEEEEQGASKVLAMIGVGVLQFGRKQISKRALMQPLLLSIGASFMMLQMFGLEACSELLEMAVSSAKDISFGF
jgi:hypothetical protein